MANLIGQQFGQYEITGELGKGGMSTVYRARQGRINREVALKVIKEDLAGEGDFLARFDREVQTIAALSHPHIVKLFDYGQQGETLYFVAELMTGGSLADEIAKGPVSLPRVDKLLREIASALDYAHAQGVVHRDLKPHNVLLDMNGNAILTDFGLAKLLREDKNITMTGVAVGTPSYMSPEQWRGEKTDGRSDVYALGVMVYEMITGKLPFFTDSTYSLMYAHLNEPPPQIPENLLINAVIQRALAKQRETRYQTAAAFAEAFHAALTGNRGDTPQLIEVGNSFVLTLEEIPPTRSTQSIVAAPTPTLPLSTVGVSQPSPTAPLTQTTPIAPARPPATRFILPLVGVISLIAAIGIAAFALSRGTNPLLASATPASTAPLTQIAQTVPTVPDVPPTPAIGATVAPLQVAPVAANEHMVLIAQLEQSGKLPINPTRQIVDDLTQTLETGIPFSKIRVREYNGVITSPDQARAAAAANNAIVVIWGNATETLVDVQVQIGVTTPFKYNKFAERDLRRLADVRLRMSDARRETAAQAVISIINLLEVADGNGYESLRNLALLDQLESTPAEIVGNTLAARMVRAELVYVRDPRRFIDDINRAIDLDAGNPIPYLYRSLAHQRNGMFEPGRRDAETALKLAPPGWVLPNMVLAFDHFMGKRYSEAIKLFDDVIASRPDDWFPHNYRGMLHYFNKDYDRARADLEKSISLQPSANYPYVIAAVVALRQGRISDGRQLIQTILNKFPDPRLGELLLRAAFGDPERSSLSFGPLISGGTNLFLGQYDAALRDADLTIKIDPTIADAYLTRGLAYCALGKYKEAQQAYTDGLAQDPSFALLYLLRAETHLRQNNPAATAIDIAAARNAKLGAEVEALIVEGLDGKLSCTSFLNFRAGGK